MEWLRQFGQRAPSLFGVLAALHGVVVRYSYRRRKLLRTLRAALPSDFAIATPDHAEQLSATAAQLAPDELRFFAPHPLDTPGFRRALRSGSTVGIVGGQVGDPSDGQKGTVGGYIFVRLLGKSAWIGYMVSPPLRGRGVARRGIALLREACRCAGYTVRATIHKENAASLRAAAPYRMTASLGERGERGERIEIELLSEKSDEQR